MEAAMYDLIYIIELLSSVLFKVGILVAIVIYLKILKKRSINV